MQDLFISADRVAADKNIRPPFGPLGELVDIRTYRRWLRDEGRRETVAERNARVVNYNIALALGKQNTNELQQEADLMYDMLNNLKVWPSGRTAWVGGTSTTEQNPAANFNCLRRDTEFLTSAGVKTFKDFESGDTVEVLTKTGAFKKATVTNFGKQKLLKLVLGRLNTRKEIFVTANHNWFVYKHSNPTKDQHIVEKTTSGLSEGDVLQQAIMPFTYQNLSFCNVGVQHGLVFGDGYYEKKTGRCRITLCGDSTQFFDLFTTGNRNSQNMTITGLPWNWKELPDLEKANPEYLLGFLMGWFAADGSFSSSGRLFNKSKEVLEWARGAFAKVGIGTNEVELQRENNPFTGQEKGFPLYYISLHKSDVSESFLLKENHLIKYNSSASKAYWKVKSVERTELEEDVWCVTEPETSSFTLAGGVLTGNCSFLAINRMEAFADLNELLMLGTGVGFRVHSKDISKLPVVVNWPEIVFENLKPVPKDERRESTVVRHSSGDRVTISVGDSREGWIDALRLLFASYTGLSEDITHIEGFEHVVQWAEVGEMFFEFNHVRPMGERIKGFGGTASGADALKGILKEVSIILEDVPTEDTGFDYIGKIRSIDAMDICCAIAKGVVAGSSRRSALICLFEEGDKLCAQAKKGLYTNPDLASKSYRSQSNNTENIGAADLDRVKEFLFQNPSLDISSPFVEEFLKTVAPSVEELAPKFETVKTEGEPGFDNWARMVMMRFYAATKWRPHLTPQNVWDNYCDVGTNPCHEIILSAGLKELESKAVSFCNLTTVPLPNHLRIVEGMGYSEAINSFDDTNLIKLDPIYELDLESLEAAFRMATRIGLRQTCVEMPYEHMNLTQTEERLLGVSATGWRDLFDALDWETGSPQIQQLQESCRYWCNDEATKYAKELGVPRPLLVTTIKPEGTASQIFGTGSGLHWDWAPFYIRRIRMSAGDALAKTLIEQGFKCYPELYDLQNYRIEYSSIPSIQRTVDMENLAARDKRGIRSWFYKLYRGKEAYPDITEEEIWNRMDNWTRLEAFNELTPALKEAVLQQCNTVVFEFPVKSLTSQSQASVSAIEQLENMKSFTQNYCDHMPSSTITVKPDEWDGVIKWVSENWASFTTASFLPFYGGGYPLLPNEEITETRYEKMISEVPDIYKVPLPNGKIMFKVDETLLRSIEFQLVDPDDIDLSAGCDKGCPVR